MSVIPALTGTIPVIAVAGITVKYKEAMLDRPLGRRRKARSKSRRRRTNFLGGTSPF